VPEGHTLHRLAHRHTDLLVGRQVQACSPQGRFADGAARIDGRTVRDVTAVGKHLLYTFDGLPTVLHVHLGLYGTFVDGAPPAPEPRGALRLRLTTERAWVDLRGPTACELIDEQAVERLVRRLGPDPLAGGLAGEAWPRVSRSDRPMGALLLDQSVVAGVGNVYRAEILFRHGMAPTRPGRAVTADEWSRLWSDLLRLMRRGVRAGRIVTTARDHRLHPRGRATRDDSFYVYRRTGLPCRICATPVRAGDLAARTIYWCPSCQPG
jgi:endonuclease-8